MTGNSVGIWRGVSNPRHPPDILGSVADGSGSRGLLRDIVPGITGVVEEDPLSPTIFNVVVDAMVRHWVEVMAETAGRQDRRGREGRYQNAHFYADDIMVASSDP